MLLERKMGQMGDRGVLKNKGVTANYHNLILSRERFFLLSLISSFQLLEVIVKTVFSQ